MDIFILNNIIIIFILKQRTITCGHLHVDFGSITFIFAHLHVDFKSIVLNTIFIACKYKKTTFEKLETLTKTLKVFFYFIVYMMFSKYGGLKMIYIFKI